MSLECKILYLFLLTTEYKICDLFYLLHPVVKTRCAFITLMELTAGEAYIDVINFDKAINKMDSFIKKYRVGCIMQRLYEDYRR